VNEGNDFEKPKNEPPLVQRFVRRHSLTHVSVSSSLPLLRLTLEGGMTKQYLEGDAAENTQCEDRGNDKQFDGHYAESVIKRCNPLIPQYQGEK